MEVFKRLIRPKPSRVYDAYWRFAVERQAIFLRRIKGDNPPWTSDAILNRHRFTNCYRAADRVSQFLIRNVIYLGLAEEEEVVFRIMLFRFFNRIETWNMLISAAGPPTWRNWSFGRYSRILSAS